MRQWLWAPNLQHCVSGSGPTAPPNDMGRPYHLISKKVAAPFFSQRWCHRDTVDANPCLEIQLWPLQDPKEAQWIKPGSKAVICCNQRSRLHLSQLPQVPSQQTLCSRETWFWAKERILSYSLRWDVKIINAFYSIGIKLCVAKLKIILQICWPC